MRRIAIAVALLSALPLAAQRLTLTLTLTPARPNSEQGVVARVDGLSPGPCKARNPVVSRSGTDVTIHFSTQPCVPSLFWSEFVGLGYFEPGLYHVSVAIDEHQQLRQSTLYVTEVNAPIQIYSTAAPERGGVIVDLITPLNFCNSKECEPLSVTFGGVPATKIVAGRDWGFLRATVPPHAEGAVDVTIANAIHQSHTVRAGLVYFRESSEPDFALFEPLLFPILADANGLAGSHWKTEAVLANRSHEHALITQRPVDAAGYLESQAFRVASGAEQHPRGLLWLPLRDLGSVAGASLTLHETSRGSAVELPVVREDGFDTIVDLVGIPNDRRYRAALRIYSLEPPDPFFIQTTLVDIRGLESNASWSNQNLSLTRQRDDEPWFAMIPDLLVRPSITEPVKDSLLKIRIFSNQKVWAFVSVVDNETQQTRIITPLR